MNDLQKLIKQLGANKYKKGKVWNGFNVFEPVYNQNVIIGEPTVVLEKNGKYRLSTYDESFEYQRFITKDLKCEGE